MNDKELICAAMDAMKGAYAPYSGFYVGAALLCESGEVYTVSFGRYDLGISEGEPFRIMVSRDGRMPSVLMTNDRTFRKLVVGEYSPDAFAFIIPKNNLNK